MDPEWAAFGTHSFKWIPECCANVVQILSLLGIGLGSVASMLLRDVLLPSRWQPADLKLGQLWLCNGHLVVALDGTGYRTVMSRMAKKPKRPKRPKPCFKLRGKMHGFTAMPCWCRVLLLRLPATQQDWWPFASFRCQYVFIDGAVGWNKYWFEIGSRCTIKHVPTCSFQCLLDRNYNARSCAIHMRTNLHQIWFASLQPGAGLPLLSPARLIVQGPALARLALDRSLVQIQ